MTRNELALAIGNHVLKCFDAYMKNPVGKKQVTAHLLPKKFRTRDFKFIYPRFGEWIMSVECSAPPLIQMTTGPGEYEFLSPSEYFRINKQLGWEP